MSENKILFTGPLGVGVSTAIKNISDIPPATKKEKINNAEHNEATVEMDYGILKLDTGDQIQLYGAPDRETVNLVSESLDKNYIGMILLINNTDVEPVRCMLQNVEHYQELVDEEAIAVGLTKYDDTPTPDINEFHIALREKKLNIPVFSVNIHDRDDIITLIKALLYNLDSGVN